LPPQEILDRWFSEPIKAIVVPTSLFLSNKAGFPVLTKAHQKCLMKFMKLSVDVIIEGICRHEHGNDKYREYINYLYRVCIINDLLNVYFKEVILI
jgi:type II protein arginine methyltransferase